MRGWLLTTAGTAALGSVFPLVNIELYLIGAVSAVNGVPWWALALAATVGQLAGKTLLYFAGRGSLTLGRRMSRMTAVGSDSRWAKWMWRFQHRAERQPWWALMVLFVGAVASLPPFTVMCFAVGAAGIGALGFLGVSFLGRTIHFLIVAGAPELIRHLPLFG
ncbi:membrane protein YqaA with SNARE-associated domain [Saccharopolyspora lacisalsi]|uniref:Membrane protein YqaA with SNARE-associated domain n=1 Tax=Halosaccharopolyspora lacisalsi TaxID=1000566 RepID=A0A839DU18_9PSEU|nr:VTT domain-containing protein [Halosaccharopolyspora lacisalsi]MBA8824420.1 membrane protein YqaA with SNARE-associated domain [Halosaccharopolyspora lacisalsi]